MTTRMRGAGLAALLVAATVAGAAQGAPRLDTKPGCFGAGEQGQTRDHLENAKALKILSVHKDVTGITVLDNKHNTVFKGMPRAGQVIPLSGMQFVYLQATTRGTNGCLVKYQPQ